MAKDEVKGFLGGVLWLAVIVAVAVLAYKIIPATSLPQIQWRRVLMDGSRTGVGSVSADNAATAFGVAGPDGFVTPSGASYGLDSPVAGCARILTDAQPGLATLKKVVARSASSLPNLRTVPDLPLGKIMADAMREGAAKHFRRTVDFSMLNYGGIRCPLPEGPVTLEVMESMFPFKNYLVLVKMKGSDVRSMLEKLAKTKAFLAVSGLKVHVVDHVLTEALVGGAPLDDNAYYNVATIDFLFMGGDNVSMIPNKVWFSEVLMKDVALDYVSALTASGKLVEAPSDVRVIME